MPDSNTKPFMLATTRALKHLLSYTKTTISKSIKTIKRLVSRSIHKLYKWLRGLAVAIYQLWCAIGPLWIRVLVSLVIVIFVAYHYLGQFLKPNLTAENIYQVRYLNEGWSDQDRENYYYTPQGTELLGLEYDWLVNLELPLSHELFATEENMRGWGFIVNPAQHSTKINPGNLPVGFSQHIDSRTGRKKLDLSCAMCHTGELHYKGTALRIDGGQSVQSISTAKRGEFITTLGASTIETLFNPAKWDRFATRIAGDDKAARKTLRREFWAFGGRLKTFISGAGASKWYPVEEGRGRTDAVGRIANIVFGYDLDQPENYRVADAPASYPFLWDIWRFDWVQYTGFTNQAMARNVGESLGVLAPIKLVGEDGKLLDAKDFGETVINLDGMHCVEGILRELEPPKWPESVLGEINIDMATQGKTLFAEHCVGCHGPHISEPYLWPVEKKSKWEMAGDITTVDGKFFRKDWRERIWSVPWIDSKEIGTDAKLVDNYIDTKYDASKIAPGSKPVNAGDGLNVLLSRLVPLLYERWDITGQQIPNYDGLNVPFKIANKRAYKARPLHGVWATPPFLHNGSVPTIYDLLSTQNSRPTTFYVGNREYNPSRLGYQTGFSVGSFKHDTTITGNGNGGHLFTDLDVPGRIGSRLSEQERMSLLEYIKIMGNPGFSEQIGGDPLNWQQYSSAPEDKSSEQACERVHSFTGIH